MVEFADLLRDSRRNERGELLLAAAADEARHRQLGKLVGSASNLLLLAGGVGATARATVNLAFETATSRLAPVTPREIPQARNVLDPFDLITVAAITAVPRTGRLDTSPGSTRSRSHNGTRSRSASTTSTERTAPAAEPTRPKGSTTGSIDEVPTLSAYLFELHKVPGLHDLRQFDHEACPDT